MADISRTTWARFQVLAQHPKADMSPEAMVNMCVECGMPFESYAATLTLQLAVTDAIDVFSNDRKAEGYNQRAIMISATAACANSVAWLTNDEPMPGSDIAHMMANDIVVTFANFLAPRIAVKMPPAPSKPPTIGGNSTRH